MIGVLIPVETQSLFRKQEISTEIRQDQGSHWTTSSESLNPCNLM